MVALPERWAAWAVPTVDVRPEIARAEPAVVLTEVVILAEPAVCSDKLSEMLEATTTVAEMVVASPVADATTVVLVLEAAVMQVANVVAEQAWVLAAWAWAAWVLVVWVLAAWVLVAWAD